MHPTPHVPPAVHPPATAVNDSKLGVVCRGPTLNTVDRVVPTGPGCVGSPARARLRVPRVSWGGRAGQVVPSKTRLRWGWRPGSWDARELGPHLSGLAPPDGVGRREVALGPGSGGSVRVSGARLCGPRHGRSRAGAMGQGGGVCATGPLRGALSKTPRGTAADPGGGPEGGVGTLYPNPVSPDDGRRASAKANPSLGPGDPRVRRELRPGPSSLPPSPAETEDVGPTLSDRRVTRGLVRS